MGDLSRLKEQLTYVNAEGDSNLVGVDLNALSDTDFRTFCIYLQSHRARILKLGQLNIVGLSVARVTALGEALASSESLDTISFGLEDYSHFTNEQWVALGTALGASPKLKTLSFDECNLGGCNAAGLQGFATLLTSCQHVTDLYLSTNNLGNLTVATATLLGNAITRTPALQTLKISDSRSLFAERVPANSIEFIPVEALAALMNAVGQCRLLRKLILGSIADLSDQHLATLAALNNCRTLTKLYLGISKTEMGLSTAKIAFNAAQFAALSTVFSQLGNITELELANLFITEKFNDDRQASGRHTSRRERRMFQLENIMTAITPAHRLQRLIVDQGLALLDDTNLQRIGNILARRELESLALRVHVLGFEEVDKTWTRLNTRVLDICINNSARRNQIPCILQTTHGVTYATPSFERYQEQRSLQMAKAGNGSVTEFRRAVERPFLGPDPFRRRDFQYQHQLQQGLPLLALAGARAGNDDKGGGEVKLDREDSQNSTEGSRPSHPTAAAPGKSKAKQTP